MKQSKELASTSSLSNNEIIERTRFLINTACKNLFWARDLREAGRELRYANSDFREFLREQRLRAHMMAQSMHERWLGRS